MTTQNSTERQATSAEAVVKDAMDPSRRPDVLFRVRRAPGEEASPWWNIGAFLVFTVSVVSLLSLIP